MPNELIANQIPNFPREIYVELRQRLFAERNKINKLRQDVAGNEYAFLTSEIRGIDDAIQVLEGAYYGDN